MTIAPGLKGTFDGTCIVCFQPTDTGFAVKGEAEAAIAALLVMGVPEDQGVAVVSRALGCGAGTVPEGEVTVPLQVCSGCAAKLPHAQVGLVLPGGELPVYAQRW